MSWWLIVVIVVLAWLALSVVAAIGIGRMIRLRDQAEEQRYTGDDPDEVVDLAEVQRQKARRRLG